MAFKPLAIKNIERTKPVDSNGITRCKISLIMFSIA
jgi:hypothetical protein